MKKKARLISIFIAMAIILTCIVPIASAEETKTYTQQYLGDGFHRITSVPQTDAEGNVTNKTFEIAALETKNLDITIEEDGTYGVFISQNKVSGAYPDNNFGLSFTKGTGEDAEVVTVSPIPTAALATTTKYAYVRIGADNSSTTAMHAKLSKGTWTMSFTPFNAVSLNYIDLRSVVIPVDGSKQAIYPIDVYGYTNAVGRYLNDGASGSLDRFLGYEYYGDLYNENLASRTFNAKGITVLYNKTATYKLDVKESGTYAVNLYLRHYIRSASVTKEADVTINPIITATGNDPVRYPHTFAMGSGSGKSYMEYNKYIVNLAEGENNLTVNVPNIKDTSIDLYFIALEKIDSYLGDGYTKLALQNEAFSANEEKTFEVDIPEDGDYAVFVKKAEKDNTSFTASFTNGAKEVTVADGGANDAAYAYNYVRLGAKEGTSSSSSANLTKGKWTLKLSSSADITVSDIEIRKTTISLTEDEMTIYPSDYNTLEVSAAADVNANLQNKSFIRAEGDKYFADYTTQYSKGINLGASKSVTYDLKSEKDGKYKISVDATVTGTVTLSAGDVTNEAVDSTGCEKIVTLSKGVNTLTISSADDASAVIKSIKTAEYDENKVNTHSITARRINEFVKAARKFYNDEAYLDYSLTLTDIYETSQNDDVPGVYIPQTLTLDWEDIDGANSYKLYVSKTEDFSDAVVTVSDITESTYNVTDKINLYADTVYYWYAEADNGTKTEVETFYTEDTVRTVYIDGVDNSRDIGGWNGLHPGRAYRSAKLSGIDDTGEVDTSTSITEKGIDTVVNDLGVKTQLDLRGYNYTEGPLGDGVKFIATQIGSYMSAFTGTVEYAKTIRVFADSDNYPIIFHCAGGCDRTGTVAFIIQALSGVSEGDLATEFELTNFSRYYRNRDRDGDYFYYDDLIKKLKEYDGDTIQEKAENYALSTLELTRSEITNIQSMMAGNGVTFAETENAVIGKATKLTLKDLGNLKVVSLTHNGANKNYSLKGNVLSLNCKEEGTYVITLSDGSTMKFDAKEKQISFESAPDVKVPTILSLGKGNTPELAGASGTSNFLPRKGQFVTENEKYIVVSMCSGSFFNNLASAVQVFDKETGTLMKTFTRASSDPLYYCPAKTVTLDGDTVYITWSNGLRASGTSITRYFSTEGCPTVAYDLSKLALETNSETGEITFSGTVNEKTIDSGSYNASSRTPLYNAANSYVDKNNGVVYTSKVTSITEGKRYYSAFKTDNVESAIAGDAELVPSKLFHTTGNSINSVQFIYKDGFFYEVLQQNCGLSGLDKATYMTLKDSEGNALNNMVYVYDLRKADISSVESTDITSYLRGIYTTELIADAAITDIEVYGDYMYLSTTDGIEVVSVADAKSNTTDQAVGLSKSATLTEEGVGTISSEVEVYGGYMFVVYRTVTVDETTTLPSAVAIYDLKKNPAKPQLAAIDEPLVSARRLSIDEANSIVYILDDTDTPPTMSAYRYELVIPAIVSLESVTVGDAAKVQTGKYDINVSISNADLEEGKLLCAIYEGSSLADLLIDADISPDGTVTMAEGYEISDKVTKIKVMYFKDIDETLMPVCSYKEITR